MMGKTFRKDRDGKTYNESLKKRESRYKCRCEYCLGKKDIADKIAEKEMIEEIRTVETSEHIDFDIPEQDEILEQIMGR